MAVVFTLSPLSWHTRANGAYQGQYGSTKWGGYLSFTAGGTDYYAYETHDDGTGRYVGVDPGVYVAGLSGDTGIEVQHPAGDRTAAQRATTLAAAIATATGLSTSSGTDTVQIVGATGGAVGGMWPATRRAPMGCRRNTPSISGSVISEGVAGFGTSPSGRTVIVKAIRVYVSVAGADMRAAVYTGGTLGSLTGTTLRAQVVVPNGATGWRTIPLLPSQVFSMTSATNYRVALKGQGGVVAPAYMSGGSTGTDLADQLEVFDTGAISPDPAVAWPSSLAGVGLTGSFSVSPMIALEYVDSGGTATEWVTRWGTQVAAPTALSNQSSLTSPDPGGADLFMGQAPPDVLGLRLRAHAVGYGSTHSSQLRLFVAQGGSVGDAEGVTILWQARGTGSATDAWVETTANDAAIDRDQTLWWGVRNNVNTVTFRFAFNVNFEAASPDDNPSDFVAASEWEAFNSTNADGVTPNAHVTDPAVAVPSPFSANTGAVQENTNHPAAYLVLYVPADTAADAADPASGGCWLLTGVVCDRD